jgi:hypothetical protein
MHDYHEHSRCIIIANEFMSDKSTSKILSHNAQTLVEEALKQSNPAHFLNAGFKLHGFFRP